MYCSRFLAAATIIVGATSIAAADWDQFCHKQKVRAHECKIDFLRNQCWPHPFRENDAFLTRDPFRTMANNGWRLHHTLSHDVFREGDAMLTAVGRNRVHWIATQSPEHRRYVYVLQGATREDTDRRVQSVNEALTHLVSTANPPQVMVTTKIPALTSGEWNRRLSQARQENMVAPMLLDEGGGGTGN